MLAELSPDQRLLAEFMSEVSEYAYYAGWMVGLEFALWDALDDGHSEWGRLDLTGDQRVRLRQLSDACAGWIIYDDQTWETFVPIAAWSERFATWLQTR